jgi:hypothetical protein
MADSVRYGCCVRNLARQICSRCRSKRVSHTNNATKPTLSTPEESSKPKCSNNPPTSQSMQNTVVPTQLSRSSSHSNSPQHPHLDSRPLPRPQHQSLPPKQTERLYTSRNGKWEPVDIASGDTSGPALTVSRRAAVSPVASKPVTQLHSKTNACPSCGQSITQCSSVKKSTNLSIDIRVDSLDHHRLVKYIDKKTQHLAQDNVGNKFVKLNLILRHSVTRKQVEVLIGLSVDLQTDRVVPVVRICHTKQTEIVYKLLGASKGLKKGDHLAYMADCDGILFGALVVCV